MTETRAEYLTKTEVEITEHRCPNCETVFGAEIPNGHLDIGGLVVDIERLLGKCAVCDATIKYYSTDYRMKKMTEGIERRAKQMRKLKKK